MDTRDRLLDSAEAICRSQGFDAFSYAHLSADIGIRKASIHYHFPTKDDLAVAMMERYCARFQDRLQTLSTTSENAAARLRGYLDLYREALSQGEQICLCVAMSLSRPSLSEGAQGMMTAFHQNSIEWLIAAFEAGEQDGSVSTKERDPRAKAMATLALVEGAHILTRVSGTIETFDDAVRSFRRQLDKG
ncbi:MAG: TetR/AcrR family transcriptional regulator [Pseudomonadota bacterium]